VGGAQVPAGHRLTGRRLWKRLRLGRGRYFEAKKKDNLEEIYTRLAEELRGSVSAELYAGQAGNDSEFHKVAVKAKNGDLVVTHRREGIFSANKEENVGNRRVVRHVG